MSMLWIVLGLVALFIGGELLVAGASGLARAAGLAPLVVGLTVVAFATSSPELFASVTAAMQGVEGLSLGTILGSNVANLGLILGLSALVRPLRPHAAFVRREVTPLVVVAALPFLFLMDDHFSRWEGLVMVVLLGLYVLYLFKSGAAAAVVDEEEPEAEAERPWWWLSGALAGGLALLIVGAKWTVDGATGLATTFGVSERVIGLSLVAFGTSLPELASSLAAARRRQGDLILGNVVGSNVFNVLCVLGITVLVLPFSYSRSEISLELWMGLGLSLALIPMLALRPVLGRIEGALLVLAYLVYVFVLYV